MRKLTEAGRGTIKGLAYGIAVASRGKSRHGLYNRSRTFVSTQVLTTVEARRCCARDAVTLLLLLPPPLLLGLRLRLGQGLVGPWTCTNASLPVSRSSAADAAAATTAPNVRRSMTRGVDLCVS